MAEGLRERVARLEAELTQASGRNIDLERELGQARTAAGRAGAAVGNFSSLTRPRSGTSCLATTCRAPLPVPSSRRCSPIFKRTGRTTPSPFVPQPMVQASRSLPVAADWKSAAGSAAKSLLGQGLWTKHRCCEVQFSENERREDISALERSRWFAEVKALLDLPSKDIALQFRLDPSTLSLYLRLARFPSEIITRLADPRRLSVLRARRVMEALETDDAVLPRILAALDAPGRVNADPDAQIDTLMRAAEGRGGDRPVTREPIVDRRHVVHRGRRVGTLTRNGGQWVFRFATTIGRTSSRLLLIASAIWLQKLKPSPKPNRRSEIPPKVARSALRPIPSTILGSRHSVGCFALRPRRLLEPTKLDLPDYARRLGNLRLSGCCNWPG